MTMGRMAHGPNGPVPPGFGVARRQRRPIPGGATEAGPLHAHFGKPTSRVPHVKRILVIDDDAQLREHCAAVLRLDGYDVLEARNGAEGLERARRDAPDLVLCDITMPEMNGHRVLEQLRQEPQT